MDRRRFLQGAGLLAGAGLVGGPMAWGGEHEDGWRTFVVTTQVDLPVATEATRVWVPCPLGRDVAFQREAQTTVHGGNGQIVVRPNGEPGLVMARFAAGAKPTLRVESRVQVRDWSVDPQKPGPVRHLAAEERRALLQSTTYVPTDGIVRSKAREIVQGTASDEEGARAIYDWVVTNSYRKASVRGCGRGDIRVLLESGDLGGKCADLSALFVGLARAAGYPAREVYGLRVAPSRLGYKSLGPATEVVSKAQHCRAEVWLQRFGWVPVDPADVRKVMLEEPPGDLPSDNAKVQTARQRLFGTWEMNWVALNYAQDVQLPGSRQPALPFFMYPQAETASGRLDSLDPDAFRYRITAVEV